MKCTRCKQYTSGLAGNRCAITGDEYFAIQFNCDLVDESGNDNGKFDELMREYEEKTNLLTADMDKYRLPW